MRSYGRVLCLSALLFACESGAGSAPVPSCVDGQKNGDETGLDCGGTCPQKCTANQGCTIASDCESARCTGGVCAITGSCDQDSDCPSGNCDSGLCAQTVTLTSIAPALSPVGTATPITLTGSGFKSGQSLFIGTTPASGVTATNMAQIQATAPIAVAPSLLDVVLQYANNKRVTLGKSFRYYWGQVGLARPTYVFTSGGTRRVAAADLNADGKPDVITVDNSFGGGNISVFPGNGDGTFKTTDPVYLKGSGPNEIAVGDA